MSALEIARKALLFAATTIGTQIKKIEIEQPPKALTKKGLSQRWKEVNINVEDVTSCYIEVKKGHVEKQHLHEYAEQGLILNRDGAMRIITKTKNQILKFPHSYFLKANEVHYIEFLEDTKLLVNFLKSKNEKSI